jgi:hypothetical protein
MLLSPLGLYSWDHHWVFPVFLGLPLAIVSLVVLKFAWQNSLELEIDLHFSPREAICWRKSILTGRESRRCYPIHDEAKVLWQCHNSDGFLR